MKIFLAGATGAIGRMLLPMLLEAGHEVAGLTSRPDRGDMLRSSGARPIVLDVFNREGVLSTLNDEKPDAIIDQITSLSGWDYEANRRIRIVGTRNLVDGALAVGTRSFIAQSYPIYAPGNNPACEEDPFDLDSPAARTIIDGVIALENMVIEVGHWVILRYGTLYGPGTWYSRTGEIADQVRRGELVANDEVTSFIQVGDAARAALLALDWPNGIFNIVDNEPAPATEWMPLFAAQVGASAPPLQTGGGISRPGISNEKARRELGWEPVYKSWREGFVKALG